MLYTLFLSVFHAGIRLAALFHDKARLWVAGRRDWRRRIRAGFQKTGRVLWVHVASLGEFEQGRPLIEDFRARFSGWQIVLTFFSPSGYEIRKNYPHADFIAYLPLDTRRNARDFLDLIRPDAAVFVKYEFWAHYLLELKRRRTPVLLISALFREKQPFFHWWGGFWRQMLGAFTHIFVQNEASATLLQGIGVENVTVAGDTRVDRVLRLAEQAPENEVVRAFAGDGSPLFIAGSAWPADEAVFLPVLQRPEFQHYKVIIAPHEPSESHLRQLETRLAAGPFSDRTQPVSVRYSQAGDSPARARFLLIDNIGMLNTLYRYGTVAWIGGGFGRGIHNTLEPAAWGLPVLFGPKYEKFEEARQLVARGGAFAVRDETDLAGVLARLGEETFYRNAVDAVKGYLEESRGATGWIIEYMRKGIIF